MKAGYWVKLALGLAQNLHSGKTDFDEDEFLNLVKMPLSQAVDQVMAGEICDSKTICGRLMAQRLIQA